MQPIQCGQSVRKDVCPSENPFNILPYSRRKYNSIPRPAQIFFAVGARRLLFRAVAGRSKAGQAYAPADTACSASANHPGGRLLRLGGRSDVLTRRVFLFYAPVLPDRRLLKRGIRSFAQNTGVSFGRPVFRKRQTAGSGSQRPCAAPHRRSLINRYSVS